MLGIPPTREAADAHQVVGGEAQQLLAGEFLATNQFRYAQTANGFQPAEGYLDALALSERGLLAGVPCRAAIECRAGALGRNVRRDARLAATCNEVTRVVPLVGADRFATSALGANHPQCCFALGGAVGRCRVKIDDEAVAVLH
tara:strand:- start:17286 stop:17717 length:432 start_codon:yes stop_codon:yes gene_type:complete